jgi:transcriptional regulator with XRE-family HTH domain
MATLYEQIGQKIRELRETAKLSQGALADKVGEAANTVSRWESGKYKVTPEDLDKLAREFKVSITIFFPGLAPDEQRIAALTSATGGLDKKEFDEVLRYAEYRKARLIMDQAKKSKAKS